MECVGKILEIDFKKSDPNSDAKPNFFPNSDGKLFFFPNNDGKLFFYPNNDVQQS